MNPLFLMATLLLALAALLLGNAWRGRPARAVARRGTQPPNPAMTDGGNGRKPPSLNPKTLGKNRFICCSPRRHPVRRRRGPCQQQATD